MAIPFPDRLNVVVLTCGDLGIQVASELAALDVVDAVSLITAPGTRRQRRLPEKIRYVHRREGLPGVLRAVGRHLQRPVTEAEAQALDRYAATLPSSVRRLHFADLHSRECIEAVRGLPADLGVVAGTYILREELFAAPRLGSINLHSGKAPEYRGSAPAFWELYNGEREVGITIHRVTASLDAGQILRQEMFPLDPAPAGDPVAYLERYRRDVLRPNGVRLLVETVRDIAMGSVREITQDPSRAKTYKLPEYRDLKELRRRVRERRRAAGAV